jgi:pimeloyl-ACP methyl ester carboxylesterase
MAEKYASVYKSAKFRDELLGYYDRVLRNWPVPFEERFLETPSGKTHILVCGSPTGRPLLFFHGTGNNSLMWRYNVEGLGRDCRLILVDTINDPGKSEASVGFDPQTGYARWITEVLDALELRKALIIGHSKGGWIALNAAIGAADRVERIALLAPAVGINSTVSRKFMAKSLRIGLFPTRRAVESYLKYVSGPGARINPDYADYLSRMIRGTRMRLIKHRRFTDEELQGIAAPVLLLFGDHEVCVDHEKVIDRAKSCITLLDVHVIPGTGHALQGEKPEEINALISSFMRG